VERIHRTLFKRVSPQRGKLQRLSPPGQQLSSGLSTNRFDTSTVHFMTIFVGNLSFAAEVEDLENLFAQYGTVQKCTLPLERETGRKRGFAFVDLASNEEETKAIDDLQNVEWMGRGIRVNKAEPRGNSGGGAGGGGRGGRSRW
jgi:RNA recognition motif-containing protein